MVFFVTQHSVFSYCVIPLKAIKHDLFDWYYFQDTLRIVTGCWRCACRHLSIWVKYFLSKVNWMLKSTKPAFPRCQCFGKLWPKTWLASLFAAITIFVIGLCCRSLHYRDQFQPPTDQQTMLDIETFTKTLTGVDIMWLWFTSDRQMNLPGKKWTCLSILCVFFFKSLLQPQKVGMTIQTVWSQMRLVRPENP